MKFNSFLLKTIFVFLLVILIVYSILILNESIDLRNYSYNELFINYEFGFIRRGLLGQIYITLDNYFNINPKLFFTFILSLLYTSQIVLFFLVFNKLFNSNYIAILILLSPVFLLFSIYDPNTFFLKDVFVKITILTHAYIFTYHKERKNYLNYINSLKFFIIPLLIIVILIHEYQIFFIGVHILISLGFAKKRNELNSILKIYVPLIVVIILLFLFIGNEEQFNSMNQILKKYDVTLHPQLKGGLYTAIGGFYKWHFHYFTYNEFVELFISIVLGIIIFYVLFETLVKKKIISYNSMYQKNILLFFLPCSLIFILAHVDHGRNISLISTNLIVYYSTLKLNTFKFKNFISSYDIKVFKKISLLVFLIFYIFMWKLDQYAGYSMRGENNTIFESTLFGEIKKVINYLYYYIDLNIYNLPDLNL